MLSILQSDERSGIERRLPEPDRYAICCPEDRPILDFYEDQFEAVFVLLHPFIRPTSIDQKLFYPGTYPSKTEILASCVGVSWDEVMKKTDLSNLAEVDIGLRTGILGLLDEFKNEAFASEIERVEADEGIVRPNQGQFPDLLENQMLSCLQSIGYDWIWVGDEFCTERKLEWIEDLKVKQAFPCHGNLFTPDHAILITTHWDSHFSFLCSHRSRIEQILRHCPFEGFSCDDRTEVYWSLRNRPNS